MFALCWIQCMLFFFFIWFSLKWKFVPWTLISSLKSGEKAIPHTDFTENLYMLLTNQAKVITSIFLSLKSESWMLSHKAVNVAFLVSMVEVIYKRIIYLNFWDMYKTISSLKYSRPLVYYTRSFLRGYQLNDNFLFKNTVWIEYVEEKNKNTKKIQNKNATT